jgi:hypothetical protein
MTMTGENKRNSPELADTEVSVQFRNLANESAPGKLNHAVLKAARHEALSSAAGIWQATWFRPAATAAVIALSLALVLEINDTNILAPPLPAENASDAFRDAADRSAEQVREAASALTRTSQNPGADTPLSTDPGVSTDPTSLLPASQGCDEEQRSTRATWWACIESLESGGASNLAERELTALFQAFPGFVRPSQ